MGGRSENYGEAKAGKSRLFKLARNGGNDGKTRVAAGHWAGHANLRQSQARDETRNLCDLVLQASLCTGASDACKQVQSFTVQNKARTTRRRSETESANKALNQGDAVAALEATTAAGAVAACTHALAAPCAEEELAQMLPRGGDGHQGRGSPGAAERCLCGVPVVPGAPPSSRPIFPLRS